MTRHKNDKSIAVRTAVATPLTSQLGRHRILIPKEREVAKYLAKSLELTQVLPEICRRARKGLGLDVELSLELYKDPESGERYLTIYVRQEKYDARILDRIESASERFDELLEEASSFLLLTTDFRRPRGDHAV